MKVHNIQKKDKMESLSRDEALALLKELLDENEVLAGRAENMGVNLCEIEGKVKETEAEKRELERENEQLRDIIRGMQEERKGKGVVEMTPPERDTNNGGGGGIVKYDSRDRIYLD